MWEVDIAFAPALEQIPPSAEPPMKELAWGSEKNIFKLYNSHAGSWMFLWKMRLILVSYATRRVPASESNGGWNGCVYCCTGSLPLGGTLNAYGKFL